MLYYLYFMGLMPNSFSYIDKSISVTTAGTLYTMENVFAVNTRAMQITGSTYLCILMK